MGYFFDLIFLAIIVVTVLFSAKHGFVRTLLELAGFVAAFLIAFSISTPIAEFTYDSFIGPSVIKSMDEVIVGNTTNISENIISSIPESTMKIIEFFGINEAEITNAVTPNLTNNAANIADTVSKEVLRPSITGILSAVLNLILIIILIPLFRWVAKLVNKLFSYSFVGKLNKTLGGVLGILKGIAFCVIICVVINFILSFNPNGIWIITNDNLDNSLFFSTINPIIS